MPYKQQKKIILINNCIEIGLSDSDGPFSSIRISIPKKIVKSAVQRNKIKRRLRNIMNDACKEISMNLKYSYLVIAKPTMLSSEFKDIKKILKRRLCF